MKSNVSSDEALQSTSSEALKNVKSINRELLIAAAASIPAEAARALNEARGRVLAAMRFLRAGSLTARPPAKEWPVAKFQAVAKQKAQKFDVLLQDVCLPNATHCTKIMPSKLDGRRGRQSFGCL